VRQRFLLSVPGGNTHIVPLERLQPLQRIASDAGATRFPLFQRISSARSITLQPVTARALLAEAEKLAAEVEGLIVPGVTLFGANGQELGGILALTNHGQILGNAELRLAATVNGIRLTVRKVPPPVGFRSEPGLAAGEYACYFRRLVLGGDGWQGLRTESMGGSGAPVSLPALSVPPAARWDFVWSTESPAVFAIESLQVPAPEVYRDVLHAFVSACTESLRFRGPLTIRPE